MILHLIYMLLLEKLHNLTFFSSFLNGLKIAFVFQRSILYCEFSSLFH